MMVYDEISDLRSDFSSIPSHNQHLANGPEETNNPVSTWHHHRIAPYKQAFSHEAPQGLRHGEGYACSSHSSKGGCGKAPRKSRLSTYQSRSCHSGSNSTSKLAMVSEHCRLNRRSPESRWMTVGVPVCWLSRYGQHNCGKRGKKRGRDGGRCNNRPSLG